MEQLSSAGKCRATLKEKQTSLDDINSTIVLWYPKSRKVKDMTSLEYL